MHSDTLLLWLAFCWLAGVGLVYRSWQVWRQSGINPVVLPHDDSAQGWIGRQFRRVLLATTVLMLIQLWWPMPALWRLHDGLPTMGWLLLVLACLLMHVAQHQMGQAWRIGFADHERTPLVTHGVFSRSRNPIFLAIRLAMWGWLLIQPSAASLVLCLLADALMQVQVRLEEAHLIRLHGETYQHYQRQVRRWM